MNPILFQFGNITIYWYSFFILMASLVGGFLAIKEALKFNIDKDFIVNLLFYMIPIVIIGARLYYVVFNFDYYKSNPIDIVKIWEGGLAIHGGIIFGLIWVIYYSKKHKVNTYRLLDIGAVSIIIGQAIGRWGNFFNSEAHGPITTLQTLKSQFIPDFIINGMYINYQYYLPTFLYESIWCLIGFIILLILRRVKKIKLGQLFGIYLIWYGIGRFLIESLRTDSLMFLNLKMAQVVSILMIVGGIILCILRRKSKPYHKV